jgi:hypothetical protein
MREKIPLVVALVMIATGLSAAAARAADVHIGINVGAPPPLVVVAPAPAVVVAPPILTVAAPPPLVVVPGTLVSYVPSASFNLFVFGGRYYSFHEGHWFHAASHRGPWIAIGAEAVPRAVLGVPVTYYKVPPGHFKKEKHEGAAAHGCPPGLAKQGRC